MKKIILSCLAATLLFSCKKDDDKNNGPSGLGDNQFKIGTTTYNAIGTTAAGNMLATGGTTGSAVATFAVYFNGNAMPTQSGTFKIVSSDDADADDEIYIAAGTTESGSQMLYGSYANSNANATVTVTGGKVKIEIPEFWAQNVLASDTIKVSGKIIQP